MNTAPCVAIVLYERWAVEDPHLDWIIYQHDIKLLRKQWGTSPLERVYPLLLAYDAEVQRTIGANDEYTVDAVAGTERRY